MYSNVYFKNKGLDMNRLKKVLIFLSIFICTINVSFADEKIVIDAKSAMMVETNTGRIIYEKNSMERVYPASTTKIVTAIVVIENCEMDDMVTVSEKAISNIPVAYVVAPLYVGEEISVRDLLYALMLKSANDAAYVLAEHVGGSTEGFSEMMNNKMNELGCRDSNFVNPNGIHDDNHYTTAHDMYVISNYAMKNETFRKIVATTEYTLPATNKHEAEDRVMKNTNSMILPESSYYNKNVVGIKTGTTTQAKNCLVSMIERDGLNFLTVVLGAETANSKFESTKKLFDFGYENYTLTKIHGKGDVIQTIEVKGATDETKNLNLIIDRDITVINNKAIKVDAIIPSIEIIEGIKAPININDEIGTVKYRVDDIEYEAKLLAQNTVEEKTYFIQMISIGISCMVISIVLLNKKKRR